MKVAMGARILGYGLIVVGAAVALGWAIGGVAMGIVISLETILDEVGA